MLIVWCIIIVTAIHSSLTTTCTKCYLPTALLPQSLIAGLNTESLHFFNCTVTGAERTDVQVDELSFNDQRIVDRGIIVLSNVIDASTGNHAAIISVPATIQNNETSIECIAVNFSSASDQSPTAMFLLQGQMCCVSTQVIFFNSDIPGVTVLILLLSRFIGCSKY